jgi:hypothetical protein
MSPAKRISDPWYIAFLKNHITTMRVVQDRSEAIATAFAMLDRGIEVIGVGPMLDTGQQAVDPASLREIYRQRRRLDDCRAAANPVLEDTSVSHPQVSAPKRQR